ncbi:MAG: pyridoxal phosphate-dependent aminotransferase [Lachnospiraceae bacterium]|nr:pyridoxal phosphate-dependent aminotransferase [Lachnospiraceae bacterium]
MISKRIEAAMAGSSAIRAMFMEGREMAARYGAEHVYDFSLGNPATPAPERLNGAIRELLENTDSLELHGYMANAGYEDVRGRIAENLNQRFGTDFAARNVLMTVGAAGGLNVVLKTLLDPGDEVIVFVPYFGEYRSYVGNYDGRLVEAATREEDFQPDLADFACKITARTKAVIINTPNNPTGVVYDEETMRGLARIMEEKEREFSTDIYLISDEPYRELVYDGIREEFLTKYYRNTIVGYSFSKSLSLPGERIGYVVVPDEAADSGLLLEGMSVANRILGFVNAPSLMQKAAALCVEEKTDVDFYDRNRRTLYEGLTGLGFTCIRPQGAFYLWMKSPVEQEEQFVEAAKKYHLILVKGSAFGRGGYVRLAYCVSHETIVNSMEAFAQLAAEYGLQKQS